MKHNVKYSYTYTVMGSREIELDPEDYLDYDNEEDVERAISEEDTGVEFDSDMYVELLENEYAIPESFWDEWRELKARQNEEETF